MLELDGIFNRNINYKSKNKIFYLKRTLKIKL